MRFFFRVKRVCHSGRSRRHWGVMGSNPVIVSRPNLRANASKRLLEDILANGTQAADIRGNELLTEV